MDLQPRAGRLYPRSFKYLVGSKLPILQLSWNQVSLLHPTLYPYIAYLIRCCFAGLPYLVTEREYAVYEAHSLQDNPTKQVELVSSV